MTDVWEQMRYIPFEDAPFHKYISNRLLPVINKRLKYSARQTIKIIDFEKIIDKDLIKSNEAVFEESIY